MQAPRPPDRAAKKGRAVAHAAPPSRGGYGWRSLPFRRASRRTGTGALQPELVRRAEPAPHLRGGVLDLDRVQRREPRHLGEQSGRHAEQQVLQRGRRGVAAAAVGWLVGLQPETPDPTDHVAVTVDARLRPDEPVALVGCGAFHRGALALVHRPHALQVHPSLLSHACSLCRPVDGQDTVGDPAPGRPRDRKSTRLNSSHVEISYAVFCLKKKKKNKQTKSQKNKEKHKLNK